MPKVITYSIIGVVLLAIASVFVVTQLATASAPSGLPATQSVATTTEVGPDETNLLFAANKGCAARVVGTTIREVTLIFADPLNGDVSSTSLTSQVGFVQLASTTIAYDSGLFGCGAVYGYSFASTTLTTADMR